MANYLCVFPASDSHIDFITENPDTLYSYIDGQQPTIVATPSPKPILWQQLTGTVPASNATPEIPSDWPESEPTMIGPEINHRNVDLYHLILNETTEFVTGSGSIFQTWLETPSIRTHSAIDVTGDNEHFAFHSDQLPALLDLLSIIDTIKVMLSFTQWLRVGGDGYTPTEEECDEIASEFKQFADSIRDAISKSQGLIWISC